MPEMHAATHYSLSRLSADSLSCIFREYSAKDGSVAVFRLAQVCQKWRWVAFRDPQLWTEIHNPKNVELTRKILELSVNHLFSVTLLINNESSTYDWRAEKRTKAGGEILHLVQEHAERLLSFSYTIMRRPADTSLVDFRLHAPCLKHLMLSGPFPRELSRLYTPALETLEVTRSAEAMCLLGTSCLPQLKSFHCSSPNPNVRYSYMRRPKLTVDFILSALCRMPSIGDLELSSAVSWSPEIEEGSERDDNDNDVYDGNEGEEGDEGDEDGYADEESASSSSDGIIKLRALKSLRLTNDPASCMALLSRLEPIHGLSLSVHITTGSVSDRGSLFLGIIDFFQRSQGGAQHFHTIKVSELDLRAWTTRQPVINDLPKSNPALLYDLRKREYGSWANYLPFTYLHTKVESERSTGTLVHLQHLHLHGQHTALYFLEALVDELLFPAMTSMTFDGVDFAPRDRTEPRPHKLLPAFLENRCRRKSPLTKLTIIRCSVSAQMIGKWKKLVRALLWESRPEF